MSPIADIRITVQIQPNARRNEVTGYRDDILRLKIAAPPIEGKANRELVEYLSELLDISKSHIILEKGAASKKKVLLIQGLTRDRLEKLTGNLKNKDNTQKRLL